MTAVAFALRGQEVVADVPSDLETSLVRSWAGDGVTTVDGPVGHSGGWYHGILSI